MRTLLNTLSKHEIAVASHAICQHFSSDPKSTNPSPTIAIFSSHGPEVCLRSLHDHFPKGQLVYPLCHPGGILSFHQVSDPSELTPGKLGILEPNPNKHSKLNIEDIHIFLCPGLAFGLDGTRLGHGSGYYDRALAQRNNAAITIGTGLQVQIRETLPHDTHDIHLDYILTENGYITPN